MSECSFYKRNSSSCVFSMYPHIIACDMKLQQCPALSAQWSHLSHSLIRCHVSSTVALDALDRPVRADQLYHIALLESLWQQRQTNKQTLMRPKNHWGSGIKKHCDEQVHKLCTHVLIISMQRISSKKQCDFNNTSVYQGWRTLYIYLCINLAFGHWQNPLHHKKTKTTAMLAALRGST